MCTILSDFKSITDALSSAASLVAIVVALISWYKSAQKPLRIERIVVHKNAEFYDYILVVSNIKNYPVTIKEVSGFSKVIYRVEKERGKKAWRRKILCPLNNPFSAIANKEVGALGQENIRFRGQKLEKIPNSFVIAMKTSHGYHEIKCKAITSVEIETKALSMECTKESESRFMSTLFLCVQRLRHPWS